MGSPTIIALFARASEGTASHVGICEASSKITISKAPERGGRYCATVTGLISMQGATTRISSGISVNKFLTLKPRGLPFMLRWKVISSTASGPSVSLAGRREIRSARSFSRVSAENSSKRRAKPAAVSSCTLAENDESTTSAGMLV